MDLMRATLKRGVDSYYSVSTFAPRDGFLQRKDDLTVSRRAIVLDIDVRPDEHDKFTTLREAALALAEARKAGKLPPMSYVVNTMRGLHVYWLLPTAVPIAEWRAINAGFIATLQQSGIDPRLISDINTSKRASGIYRALGTRNSKAAPLAGAESRCHWLVSSGTPLTPEQVAAYKAVTPTSRSETPPQTAWFLSAVRDMAKGSRANVAHLFLSEDEGGLVLDKSEGRKRYSPSERRVSDMVGGCAVLRGVLDGPRPHYEDWFHLGVVLSNFSDGRKTFIEQSSKWSQGRDEGPAAAAKWDKDIVGFSKGGIKCSSMRANFTQNSNSKCVTCPLFRSDGSGSPLVAVDKAVEAREAARIAAEEQARILANEGGKTLAEVNAASGGGQVLATEQNGTQTIVTADMGGVFQLKIPAPSGVPAYLINGSTYEIRNGAIWLKAYTDDDGKQHPAVHVSDTVFWRETVSGLEESEDKSLTNLRAKYYYIDAQGVLRPAHIPIEATAEAATFTKAALVSGMHSLAKPGRNGSILLATYLRYTALQAATKTGGRVVVSESMGWTDDNKGFVCGNYRYLGNRKVEYVELDNSAEAVAKRFRFKPRGDAAKQVSVIRKLDSPHVSPMVKAMLLSMLGSTLVKFTGYNGYATLMHGEGGWGKTFTSKIGTSFWGQSADSMLSATDTEKGRNHIFNLLRSISPVEDDVTKRSVGNENFNFAQEVMRVTDSTPQAASTNDGKLRNDKADWAFAWTLTGNAGLDEYIPDDGSDVAAAARSRVIELPVAGPRINKEILGDNFDNEIFRLITDNSGWIGPLFVDYVLTHMDAVRDRVSAEMAKATAACTLTGGLGRFRNVFIAVTSVAAHILEQLGMIGSASSWVDRIIADTQGNRETLTRRKLAEALGDDSIVQPSTPAASVFELEASVAIKTLVTAYVNSASRDFAVTEDGVQTRTRGGTVAYKGAISYEDGVLQGGTFDKAQLERYLKQRKTSVRKLVSDARTVGMDATLSTMQLGHGMVQIKWKD